jgi:hypothetical protein
MATFNIDDTTPPGTVLDPNPGRLTGVSLSAANSASRRQIAFVDGAVTDAVMPGVAPPAIFACDADNAMGFDGFGGASIPYARLILADIPPASAWVVETV